MGASKPPPALRAVGVLARWAMVLAACAVGRAVNAQQQLGPTCQGSFDATVQDISDCVVITGNLVVSGPLIFRPVVLERIIGSLRIEDNPGIESLQFEFDRLVQIGQDLVIANTFLGAIDDSFDSLLSVGNSLNITANVELLFVTRSFGNLGCVLGDFLLEDVPSLNELGEGTFNSLRNVTGDVTLRNTGLQDTRAFFSLARIDGNLTVTDNRFFANASSTEPSLSPLSFVRPRESSLDGFLNLINVGGAKELDGLVADYGDCGSLSADELVATCYFGGAEGSRIPQRAFSFCQAYDRDERALFGRTVHPVPVYEGPKKIRAQRSVRYQCTQSLLTQVQSTVYLGTFSDSVELLGLQDLLASPNAGLTVFAPDDEAWVEAVGAFAQVEQLEKLHGVILNNIVQGVFPYGELRSPLEIPSLNCALSSDQLLRDLAVSLEATGEDLIQRLLALGTQGANVTAQIASEGVRAASVSCADIGCGDCAEECCCDDLCGQVGDCCIDFEQECPAGIELGGGSSGDPTTDGVGGGASGGGGASVAALDPGFDIPSLPTSGSCAVPRNARPLDQRPFLNCERVAVASQPLNPVLTAFSQRCRAFQGTWRPCLFPNFSKTVLVVDSMGVEAKIVEPNGPTGQQLLTGNGVIHVTGLPPLRGVDGTAMAAPAGVLGLPASLPSRQSVASAAEMPPEMDGPVPSPGPGPVPPPFVVGPSALCLGRCGECVPLDDPSAIIPVCCCTPDCDTRQEGCCPGSTETCARRT